MHYQEFIASTCFWTSGQNPDGTCQYSEKRIDSLQIIFCYKFHLFFKNYIGFYFFSFFFMDSRKCNCPSADLAILGTKARQKCLSLLRRTLEKTIVVSYDSNFLDQVDRLNNSNLYCLNPTPTFGVGFIEHQTDARVLVVENINFVLSVSTAREYLYDLLQWLRSTICVVFTSESFLSE